MNIIFLCIYYTIITEIFLCLGTGTHPISQPTPTRGGGVILKKKWFIFRILHTFNMGYTVLYIPVISMFLIGGGGGCPQAHMVLITVKTYYVIYFTI